MLLFINEIIKKQQSNHKTIKLQRKSRLIFLREHAEGRGSRRGALSFGTWHTVEHAVRCIVGTGRERSPRGRGRAWWGEPRQDSPPIFLKTGQDGFPRDRIPLKTTITEFLSPL